MSVDCSSVSGIGIRVEDSMLIKLGGKFDNADGWDDELNEVFKELGFAKVQNAGSYYSGDVYWYLMVHGDNLREINDNKKHFMELLKKHFDLQVGDMDLKNISDTLWW